MTELNSQWACELVKNAYRYLDRLAHKSSSEWFFFGSAIAEARKPKNRK